MIITNKTKIDLRILGRILRPMETGEYYASDVFNTLNVHSEIGSSEIVTNRGKHIIRNYGKIVAKEGCKKDEHGMKNIIITSVE